MNYTIPEKARKRLIEQGYGANVAFYESDGELVQYGLVGDVTGGYVVHGGKKLKKGDRWIEELDTKNWTVREIAYEATRK